MKILDPINTTHSIILQPRVEPTTMLVLELTNKVSKEVLEVENTYIYDMGVLSITFDLSVLESEQYSIELRQFGKVIFRDLIFCTSQDSQNYKLTENKFKFYV